VRAWASGRKNLTRGSWLVGLACLGSASPSGSKRLTAGGWVAEVQPPVRFKSPPRARSDRYGEGGSSWPPLTQAVRESKLERLRKAAAGWTRRTRPHWRKLTENPRIGSVGLFRHSAPPLGGQRLSSLAAFCCDPPSESERSTPLEEAPRELTRSSQAQHSSYRAPLTNEGTPRGRPFARRDASFVSAARTSRPARTHHAGRPCTDPAGSTRRLG
jgi:hypothetical protein